MFDPLNEKIDYLTKCYTKESIRPFLDKLMAEFKAYSKDFSLLLLDIDHFKSFNDKFGHLYGDEVLKYFSSTLRLAAGDLTCTVFRFGGDEFVLVFPGMSSKDVHRIAATIQETLRARPFLLSGKLFKMSFSGGIATRSTDGAEAQALLDNADKAMYVAKKLGRARAVVYKLIWLEYVKQLLKWGAMLGVIAVALMVVATYLGGQFSATTASMRRLKKTFAPAATPRNVTTVYLKSGSSYKGVIVRENEREIELKLSLEKGEGSVVIKRSDVKKIEGPK